MTLKDCTKAELIFVIERLQFYSSSNSYYIRRALSAVEEQRDERTYEKAKLLSDLSEQKHREYISLLKPYAGKRLMDIPDSVLRKADAAMKEAQAADRKWNKIMAISDGAEEQKYGE